MTAKLHRLLNDGNLGVRLADANGEMHRGETWLHTLPVDRLEMEAVVVGLDSRHFQIRCIDGFTLTENVR